MSIPGNINAGSLYGGPQDFKKLEIYILLGPHSFWPCTQKRFFAFRVAFHEQYLLESGVRD